MVNRCSVTTLTPPPRPLPPYTISLAATLTHPEVSCSCDHLQEKETLLLSCLCRATCSVSGVPRPGFVVVEAPRLCLLSCSTDRRALLQTPRLKAWLV